MSTIETNKAASRILPVTSIDFFKILEITDNPLAFKEHRDWAIRHAGIDKLGLKGDGQRVGILDTGCDKYHQDLEGQVVAANFIAGNKQEPLWRDTCGHGCITPDTKLFTSFCGLETIEQFYKSVSATRTWEENGGTVKDISPLNIQTISFDGMKCVRARVLAAHKLQYSGDVYRVKYYGGEVVLTPWHPVYVQTSARGKERTIKRIRADKLKTSYRLIHNDSVQAPAQAMRSFTINLDYNTHGVSRNARRIELDAAVGWLLGLIVTDGHVCNKKYAKAHCRFVVISQGEVRRNLLVEAKRIITERFGINSVLKRSDTCWELVIQNRGFVDTLISLGIPAGNKSKTCTVPPLIMKSPLETILAFVAGCIDGDGSVAAGKFKPGYVRIVSASKEFASTLYLLLRSIGIRASNCFVRGSTTSTFGATDMYHVGFMDHGNLIAQYVQCEHKRQHMFLCTRPQRRKSHGIISIEKEQYTGLMYDLTIDKHHNYLADGIIVSNTFCTGEIVAKEDGKGIVGAAPHAKAYHGRILYGDYRDNRRTAGRTDISHGIRACIAEGCGVISMSIGGPGQNPYIRDALEDAVSAGVIPIAAAGNERLEGSTYASYPASYPTVISVASADAKDLPAWFSTIGRGGKDWKQPEIAVASLEYYWGCVPGRKSYGRMIGTSMATPLIAAVALLWREARQKQADAGGVPFPTGADVLAQFRSWLHRVANDTNKNGWDPELGYGVLLLEDGEMPDSA